MSKDIKAFPSKEYVATNDPDTIAEVHNYGMMLRDYFAAKAMQAILSDPNYQEEDKRLAAQSYSVADAMMKERDQWLSN